MISGMALVGNDMVWREAGNATGSTAHDATVSVYRT
jgi:hypothetical protein